MDQFPNGVSLFHRDMGSKRRWKIPKAGIDSERSTSSSPSPLASFEIGPLNGVAGSHSAGSSWCHAAGWQA